MTAESIAQKQKVADILLGFEMDVCRHQSDTMAKGVEAYFGHEHPGSASSWARGVVKDVQSRTEGDALAAFDMCRFGLKSKIHQIPMKKPTKVHYAFKTGP
jgi:hypothetical protein